MMKKYIAESIGTFALAFAVFLGVVAGAGSPLAVPVIAGLALGLCVYSIGAISGCHINPAVTLGALSIKKISLKDAIGYIVFQFFGAAIALAVGTLVFNFHVTGATSAFTLIPFVAETIGTFLFTFGIASVMYGKVAPAASGLVIGGSLTLGALIAGIAGSAGILNPAVALALNSFSWVYILAPILGSILGMQVYKALS